jgi:hypothetical protein
MYGPAVRRKMMLEADERESCINVFGLIVEPVLRAIMGIRSHPRLTSGKTSVGHHGTQSWVAPGRPFVHLLLHLADLGGTAAD